MIREVQSGENLIYRAVDRSNAKSQTDAITLDGNTGKVTIGGSFAAPGQLLDDYWDKSAADGSAATATAEHTFMRAAGPILVKAIRYLPDAALTADASNNATITIRRRNADGTGAVTVAAVTTSVAGSGNWTQWVAVAFALTAANLALAPGQILTVQITKAGTGVVVPSGSVQLDYVLT